MSDQVDLFGDPPDDERIMDGWEAPPPVHRAADDTEVDAAEVVRPHAHAMRVKVYRLALERGPHGVTGAEAIEALGAWEYETTVRPRLSELAGERHGYRLRKSRLRRPNQKGNREIAYVARRFWSDEIHAPKRALADRAGPTAE